MILMLNFLLEAMSLAATWPHRLRFLKVFLVSSMVFEIVGTAVHAFASPRHYWYTYWVFQTLSFFLQAMLACEIAVTGKCSFKSAAWLWSGCVTVILFLVAARFWVFNPEFHLSAFDFSVASSALIGFTLLVALAFKPKSIRVWIGAMGWVVVTLVCSWRGRYLSTFPLASLAPLLIWSSCFIRRRETLSHQVKEDGYVTTTERRAGGEPTFKTSEGRNFSRDIQGAVRSA